MNLSDMFESELKRKEIDLAIYEDPMPIIFKTGIHELPPGKYPYPKTRNKQYIADSGEIWQVLKIEGARIFCQEITLAERSEIVAFASDEFANHRGGPFSRYPMSRLERAFKVR